MALKGALEICEENILSFDNPLKHITDTCTYDLKSRVLILDGKEQKLTHFQTTFLEYLLKAGNRVVGYDELEQNIWSEEGMSSNALRSLVKGLRQKLPPDTIINISKLGYKIKTEDDA